MAKYQNNVKVKIFILNNYNIIHYLFKFITQLMSNNVTGFSIQTKSMS